MSTSAKPILRFTILPRGLIPFKLFDFQKRYVGDLEKHRFVIATKFRQGGFTTTTVAWLLWRSLFKVDESSMVMSKMDREAINTCWIARHFLKNLPDFLRPEMEKETDHELQFKDTNCRLSFYTPVAACGRALNYLFIDEAAFIKDMDQHWKAVYPTLSTGGHAIVLSTVNGVGNWFEETYFLAQKKENNFHIFHSSYTEHPDYDNEEWKGRMQCNLGMKAWQQEVLCQFKPEETLEQRFEKGMDYLCDITDAEEAVFLAERKVEGEELRKEQMRVNRKLKEISEMKSTLEMWKISDNKGPGVLVFDEEAETYNPFKKQGAYVEIVPNVQPTNIPKPPMTAVEFEQLTHEQIHERFENDHKDWSPAETKHPEFSDEGILGNVKEMAEFMYEMGDPSWKERYRKQQAYWQQLEDRIDYYCDPEIMALSGLITKEEAQGIGNTCLRPDIKILMVLMENDSFPDNFNLSWLGGRLCVNEVPTQINEEDVRDAYNGLYALTSHKNAIDTVVDLLAKQARRLVWQGKDE